MRKQEKLLRSAIGAAVLCASLGAVPARAVPVSMWLAPQFGFGAASVTAAQAAGIGSLPDRSFFGGSASSLTITTPASIPGTSLVGASLASPSSGTSTWTVKALDRAYQDLWIVIQGHDPNDANASYYNDNTKIGLVVDPTDARWRLIHPAGATQYSYLAFFVGDLAQGASFGIPISYAVAQALKVVSSNPTICEFPQYRVNFLELSVPEPMLLSLLGFAGLALAIRKRRIAQ